MHKRHFLKTTSLFLGGSSIIPFACKSGSSNHSTPPPVIKNWAGNLTFSAKQFYRPASVEEVQELIRKSNKIKSFGTRHSFSKIADCDQEIISSDAFHQVMDLDKNTQTVTVGAGIRYGELALHLQQEGFALHNLASLPHISVAGACATATHGSGDQNGNLAAIVRGLEIIRADGERIRLKSGDPDFNGVVVNLGALGMVTQMTLAVQPSFQVQQEIFEHLSLDQATKNFDSIFAIGYSVSFFTDYAKDINQVWIKRRLTSDQALEPLREFYDATPATRNMHPIAANSAVNCTDQMAVPGPWHERLPHFKLDFTPSNGEELQTEYFVDRQHAPEVLNILQSMHERITPLLFIAEIRSIRKDDLWMSTAQGGDKIAFHFTWKPDWQGVKALLPDLEKALQPFHIRPHWAKLFAMGSDRIQGLYPKFNEFKSLAEKYDPNRKFRNEYLVQRLFG